MTDDELTDRLARSLHAHASTVSSPPDAWDNFVHQAGHTVAPGTGRRRRARWLPAAVVTAAVAVAAASLLAILGSPATKSSKVNIAPARPAPTTTTAATTTTVAPTASPTTVAPPAAVSTVPPVAGPHGGPVPKGFTPVSVTFVSLKNGWVLGTAPCATPPCTSMLRTNDGGQTWVGIPAPRTPLSGGPGGPGVSQVRFANLLDGWAFGPDLWATHDGGAHWHQVTINGVTPGSPVMSLEAADGLVHAAVLDRAVMIETSRTVQDNWAASSTTVPIGGGPVPTTHIVLQGDTGWLIEVDRTVVGGARLDHGRWLAWQPPCQAAGGPVSLAASSTTAMVAVCNEGVWTGPAIVDRVYLSADGGTTFHRAAAPTPLPGTPGFGSVASPTPRTIIVAGNTSGGAQMLVGSSDGGRSWRTVAHYQQQRWSWADFGFTSPTQGVAVLASPGGGTAGMLLMTTDGGNTWNPVAFRQAPAP